MVIELLHNKIVADTLTPRFCDSVREKLIPLLKDKYSDKLIGIVMYEDYISDGLLLDGKWYYPLTLRTEYGSFTEWICWTLDKDFKDGVPYSFVGEGYVDFAIADSVPESFKEKMSDRAIDFKPTDLKIKLHAVNAEPIFLSGKYSQTFIDELAVSVEGALCRALGIDGFKDSTIELQLVFAPGTYMEHTSENVTYRRLLMTDKGCQARDFWVRWTALDAPSYTVSDHVKSDSIKFELGEDVPQKIREKEYRFLCHDNPDKYQSAMGKKTVTEWRELVKRAIRRGEIVKSCVEESLTPPSADDELAALLGSYGIVASKDTAEPEAVAPSDEFERAMQMAREALGLEKAPVEEVTEEEPTEDEELPPFDLAEEDEPEEELDLEEEASAFDFSQKVEEETDKTAMDEALRLAREHAKEEANAELLRIREETMRAEIEARVRLQYEAEARARAEEEANRLRLENERLLALAKEAERQRAEEESARQKELARQKLIEEEKNLENERLRIQLEAKVKEEARERERLAEAARLAVEEQRRLEAERREREARALDARERLEEERIERERELEALRQRTERERLVAEARAAVAEKSTVRSYMSKKAKLLFRRSVDLNVIKKIQAIVEQTLVANNKQNIHIHMKAYPQDNNTITLDILKMPEEETELLVSIIKAIGNGGLGITKIILEDK